MRSSRDWPHARPGAAAASRDRPVHPGRPSPAGTQGQHHVCGRRHPSLGVPLRMRVEESVPSLWRCSPERSGRFLGERRAARQQDVQRATRTQSMAVELRVLLDPAQQLPAITLASARRPVFFGAPVAVGEPDFLAAGSSPLVQEAINPFRDHHRVMDGQGPAQVQSVHRVARVLARFPIGGENIP